MMTPANRVIDIVNRLRVNYRQKKYATNPNITRAEGERLLEYIEWLESKLERHDAR